jgi:arylsulfatase A
VEQDFSERIDRAAEQQEKVKEGLAVIREFKESVAKEGSFWDQEP